MNHTVKHLKVSIKEVQLCTALATPDCCAIIIHTVHMEKESPISSLFPALVLIILPGTVSGLGSELPIQVSVG